MLIQIKVSDSYLCQENKVLWFFCEIFFLVTLLSWSLNNNICCSITHIVHLSTIIFYCIISFFSGPSVYFQRFATYGCCHPCLYTVNSKKVRKKWLKTFFYNSTSEAFEEKKQSPKTKIIIGQTDKVSYWAEVQWSLKAK